MSGHGWKSKQKLVICIIMLPKFFLLQLAKKYKPFFYWILTVCYLCKKKYNLFQIGFWLYVTYVVYCCSCMLDTYLQFFALSIVLSVNHQRQGFLFKNRDRVTCVNSLFSKFKNPLPPSPPPL